MLAAFVAARLEALGQYVADLSAVEFRNLLVYEHAAVDDAMVYGFAKRRLGDFAEFAGAIRERADPRADADAAV